MRCHSVFLDKLWRRLTGEKGVNHSEVKGLYSAGLKTDTMLSEKLLDDRIVKLVKSLGGSAMKLTSLSFTGMPDRTVLLPGGNICFVEVKSTGKKPSKRQEIVIGWLRGLGFKVFVVSDQDSYDDFRQHVLRLTI